MFDKKNTIREQFLLNLMIHMMMMIVDVLRYSY